MVKHRLTTRIRTSSAISNAYFRRAKTRPLISLIITALHNLGDRAHLREIYKEVRRLGYTRGGKDLDKLIRSEIQKHSSDSARFIENPNEDWFRSTEFRSGIWELREPISRTQVALPAAESALPEDLKEIEKQPDADSTTKKALVDARLGQGKFRTEVLRMWGDCCAVTGSKIQAAIRASHIKPWRESSNEERLNPNNGLPLIASLDALFDTGLISFESSGKLLVSAKINAAERQILGINEKSLRKIPDGATAKYLAFHRAKNGFQ